MRTGRGRTLAVVAVAVALGLAAGCGSDSSDDATPAGTSQETATLTGSAPEQLEGTPAPAPLTFIDVDQLAAQIDDVPGLQVVDVRTDEEVAEGTIPGSIHIPVDVIEAGDTDGLDLDGPIAVICRSGSRATIAGDALVAAGATDVRVVRPGGVGTWAEAGYPITVP